MKLKLTFNFKEKSNLQDKVVMYLFDVFLRISYFYQGCKIKSFHDRCHLFFGKSNLSSASKYRLMSYEVIEIHFFLRC